MEVAAIVTSEKTLGTSPQDQFVGVFQAVLAAPVHRADKQLLLTACIPNVYVLSSQSLLVIVTKAVLLPIISELKVIVNVVDAFAAIDLGKVIPPTVNKEALLPDKEIPDTDKALAPVFWIVYVLVVGVFNPITPK